MLAQSGLLPEMYFAWDTPLDDAVRRACHESYRARYGGVASYPDYRAALEDPRIDAVVVAVPPAFHLDLTLQALAAGKHVLVEKPAFPRIEDYVAAERARALASRPVMPVGATP